MDGQIGLDRLQQKFVKYSQKNLRATEAASVSFESGFFYLTF